AQLAGIHEEIMRLPMGYETPLAEGGGGLSGGQRQRVSLARTLAKNPPALVLDEASSQVEVATQALIERILRQVGGTRIIPAHRLSTVRDADEILVLEQGTIVERGRHDELLTRGGPYARLVRHQLDGSREPAPAARHAPQAVLRPLEFAIGLAEVRVPPAT